MIGAIEQAIIDRIQAASDAGTLGYTLAVKSYGNELDDGVKAVVRTMPAVWATYMGETQPREVGGGAFVHIPTFSIMVAQQNRRNEAASRLGAAGKVGSYQILEDVRALLTGQDLGLAIARLKPGAVGKVKSSGENEYNASVFALDFTTEYESNAPVATGLDDFATFHVDWDIPPLGNVTGPLPAAENDAEDTIQPEQV